MIEELYKKYYEELINWCHSMTGNLYTAEELVHEAFLRAMLHEDTLSTLKEQQSRSWLYRTVKNLYVRSSQTWQEGNQSWMSFRSHK